MVSVNAAVIDSAPPRPVVPTKSEVEHPMTVETLRTDAQEAKLENQLRSRVRRLGFCVLRKSRCRNPDAFEYGRFRIVDRKRNCVVVGASPCAFSMTLDDVAEWLAQTAEEAAE
jgi:hypothetical protein